MSLPRPGSPPTGCAASVSRRAYFVGWIDCLVLFVNKFSELLKKMSIIRVGCGCSGHLPVAASCVYILAG